ncbi:type II toxin-antitoxin system RelE/ParE family toxin [Amycolatopsis magusensis]|uniref:type II toxin-antitoxin system RelE/ParE family toxin n=1 Tax=Amycolatopsis magusensis TaxID=882444 RepID=UPI0024A90F82|nr:type II toxin-antitoxin system RelE/ParE family toxin [Amycolatopsis magusensis]MDI5976403.1 type II toxin-antitoxin system RelE/ParE family toxin [Amycolatopsis magusensis]
MGWEIELHAEVDQWFARLCEQDPASADLVEEAIDLLANQGPALGRPLVDRIKGSSYHHLKELRPASSGSSAVRILFAFDPRRQAVLLVAGDKAGDWRGWYTRNIPIAEQRYDDHLRTLEEAGT